MPNKTIYVADEDLPLLEQAQALTGGNLSAAVARALRGFVDAARSQQAGFDEVTVWVGPPGAKRAKRFWGYQVARWQIPHADGRQMEAFTVFRTKGGRYAVHWRKGPNWGWWADPATWMEGWTDLRTWARKFNWAKEHAAMHHKMHHHADPRMHHWGLGGQGTEESLEVFETMEDLKEHVPPELFQLVSEAGQEPHLEDLDI